MIQDIQAMPDDIQSSAQDIQDSIPDLLNQLREATPNTHVVVDFDETLLLRNSTEEYLDTLQPKAVGVFFLILLDYLKPWNWLPGKLRGEVSRDWLRVLLATILFPWTLLVWSWRARRLAHTQQNQILVEALSNNSNLDVLVSTDGFRPIVAPILRHIKIKGVKLHACRLWLGGADRVSGKFNRLNKTIGPDKIATSIVITDSPNDMEVLQAASHPYLIQWSQAKYIQAMTATYSPFLYMLKFKHDPLYLLRGILMDQWFMLVLASSWLAPKPILHAAALLLLVASFWCIYELGYYENDYVAEHYEKHPKLKETGLIRPNAPLIQPWIWASLFAIPGLLLLQFAMGTETSLTDSSISEGALLLAPRWIISLVIMRLVYWVFNHIDKRSRVWPYVLLQYSRLPAFAVLTYISPAGAILLSAQTLTNWIRYIVYRYQGQMNEVPHAILRLVILSFLIAVTAASSGVAVIFTWQMATVFAFCMVRSLSSLPELIRQVRMITDDSWSPSTAE